eukprot:c11863_g1_i1.p1 GENE.c11863_g1_i1~~c11863_g1_i1.p1  ORF type:complete len:228 (+),score=66.85 c11863_g1_i1:45-686(+)
MVKLYYTASSCGAANFISAFVGGFTALETEQVDLATHKTVSGVDFYTINPKGNVPALVLDDGTVLNENAATLQYIADQIPGKVAPEVGSADRYLLQAALSYISSEVHGGAIGPFWNPTLTEEVKTFFKGKVQQKLTYLESTLIGDKHFLVGNKLSVADIYLYIVLSWDAYLHFGLASFPKVHAYVERIKALPEIQAAHAAIATSPAHVPSRTA